MIPIGQPGITGRATIPARGEVYRHFKGGLYTVLMLATEEATGWPVVVYVGNKDGKIWTRPVAEFVDWIGYDDVPGGYPRFARVEASSALPGMGGGEGQP